jgi:ubiquitin-protein ligase E3 C
MNKVLVSLSRSLKCIELKDGLFITEFGVRKTLELIPNGMNVPVTNANRLHYITLVSHLKLNHQIREQSAAFVSGFNDLIDPKWIRMFDETELKMLVGGVNEPIDLDDLKVNTVYGGIDEADDTVRYFWDVVKEFDQTQRRDLYVFLFLVIAGGLHSHTHVA